MTQWHSTSRRPLTPPEERSPTFQYDSSLDKFDVASLRKALQEAMAEPVKDYPQLGTLLDRVNGHPTIFFADNEFAYDKHKQKLYRLDDRKILVDLKTGDPIGQRLVPSSLANTPGYVVKP